MTENPPICSCITCSDRADALTVVAYDASAGLARCRDEDGRETDVDVMLIDGIAVGVRLMVHAGTAIAVAPQEVAR